MDFYEYSLDGGKTWKLEPYQVIQSIAGQHSQESMLVRGPLFSAYPEDGAFPKEGIRGQCKPNMNLVEEKLGEIFRL